MRVVVPYTTIHPLAKARLNRYAPGWRPYRMRDDDDYHNLFARLWVQHRDFAVVEHDIGITRSVVPEFEKCASLWCAFTYPGPGVMLANLGCVRFRAELTTAEPDLLDEVAVIDDADIPTRHWARLDVRLADALHRRGWTRCVHGLVAHYHRY